MLGALKLVAASQAENASSILVARSIGHCLHCLSFGPACNHVAWSLSASFRHSSPRFSVAVMSRIMVRDGHDSPLRNRWRPRERRHHGSTRCLRHVVGLAKGSYGKQICAAHRIPSEQGRSGRRAQLRRTRRSRRRHACVCETAPGVVGELPHRPRPRTSVAGRRPSGFAKIQRGLGTAARLVDSFFP